MNHTSSIRAVFSLSVSQPLVQSAKSIGDDHDNDCLV